MGITEGTAMLIGSLLMAGGTAASVAMTPKMPQQDLTDYELLQRTKEQTETDSQESQSRIDEARKREELRQQQFAQNIYTGDEGTPSLSVTNQVLGVKDKEEKAIA